MSWLPDDIREASGGEVVDHVAHDVLKLAHQAVNRFPEMKKRHMFIAGGAALSSAIIVGAGVAIVRRLRAGQTPDEAVNSVTEEELEGVRLIERVRRPRHRHNGSSPETNGTHDADAEADSGEVELGGAERADEPTETATGND
jgi:hypothetical protein